MRYKKFIVRYNLNWIFYDKKVIDVIKVHIKTLTTKKFIKNVRRLSLIKTAKNPVSI